MLYNTSFLFKSVRKTPLLLTQRWKFHFLPEAPDIKHQEKKKKASGKDVFTDILGFLHRKSYNLKDLKNYRKWRKIQDLREDQSYLPARHQFLGPNLATTHFITLRGGKVKFVGHDKWIMYEDIEKNEVPSYYVSGFDVEEVDASGTNLCYEGFDNLVNLTKLKKLHLRNCPFIDDWCLGRCHLFAHSLEHLDLSGCQLVTERGISALHPLRKLKTLVINDTPNIQNKELVCLLLQDIIPSCSIIGVNYSDPIFLKRLENFIP